MSQLAPKLEVEIAQEIITYLEHKKILRSLLIRPNIASCAFEVEDIRDILTYKLSKLNSTSELARNLKGLLGSCMKFLKTLQNYNIYNLMDYNTDETGKRVFDVALGEMRGVWGIHLAEIAARYGLDVNDEIKWILPESDNIKA